MDDIMVDCAPRCSIGRVYHCNTVHTRGEKETIYSVIRVDSDCSTSAVNRYEVHNKERRRRKKKVTRYNGMAQRPNSLFSFTTSCPTVLHKFTS